ncbi:MAG: citrate/2-methylcitrate synthase [Nitrospira sp.]|nr:citrate synthase [Candidatus Manganitrophaceae bacterium]HIL34342.1 citrate synthase [Candidatus Manganitrophaceae bacterium]
MSSEEIHDGLEGIRAGNSAICHVDHESGGLSYRGYRIEALAGQSTFEEVAYLLLLGQLPARERLEEFKKDLRRARNLSEQVRLFLKSTAPSAHPMDVLRTAVSISGMEDPDRDLNDNQANHRKAIRLISQIPIFLGAFRQHAKGQKVISSDPALSHPEFILHQLTGLLPEPADVRALEVSLILYAEHEFNASTFTARVTASSLSDLHSAVISAIGSLKGPLHGGANEAVMTLLTEVDQAGGPEKDILERLHRKERIMGFGHRVLKKEDPRSRIMKKVSESLGERKGNRKWYTLSKKIEEIMLREKGLYPNLDFYSASAYTLLGIPVTFDTPLFVCSRITGWAAHIIEQHDHNRLIRPRCRYIGEEEREYIPLNKREPIS